MAIDMKDVKQNAIGAVTGMLWIFLLRESGLHINPQTGLMVGLIWILLIYGPSKRKTLEQKEHFILSILISVIVASTLTLSFGFATVDQLTTMEFFGTLAWLGALIGIPVAVTFDMKNVDNPLNRIFVRR